MFYIIKNLKQYLSLGMKLKNVHRGISFYQSRLMGYISKKNTDLRKQSTNSFEKDFLQLMNNSVFGKTIENIRKRQNVTLIDNRDQAIKLSSKPNADRATIVDEKLFAVHIKKTHVFSQ